METPNWFLDFEGFTHDNKFWVKEICILPFGQPGDKDFDEDLSYNYFVKTDMREFPEYSSSTYNWQFRRHRLSPWFGDYHFDEAMRDIQIKVGKGKVFVKGLQKALFIAQYLSVVELPEGLCNFKQASGFYDKCCKVKHSREFCAIRKAHVLRNAYNRDDEICSKTI